MPQITTSGIVSGIDVNSLVSDLVAAERAPSDQRFERQEFDVQTELSSIGALKAAIDSFSAKMGDLSDADQYENRTVKVLGESDVNVKVESSAAPGSYDVTVNSLASAHKLASGSFTDTDTVVGSGKLSITSGAESFTVTINSENDQLSQIRDAINESSDNDAVYASIVTDEDGAHLILTAKDTGAANTISVTASPDSSDTGFFELLSYPQVNSKGFTEKVEALDAEIVVDGFTLKSTNNVFDAAIDGVDIDISAALKDEAFSFSVSNNETLTKSKLDTFVSAYNGLITGLNSLTSYDAETGVAGPMQGDALVNSLKNLMRSSLSDAVEGANTGAETLANLGVSTDYKDGTISVNSTTFDKLMEADFSALENIMSGQNGLATRFEEAFKEYSRFGGIIDGRVAGLETSLDRINSQRERFNIRMEQVEARYTTQFLAMDRVVSELINTGDFLSQQLNNLPGFTRERN